MTNEERLQNLETRVFEGWPDMQERIAQLEQAVVWIAGRLDQAESDSVEANELRAFATRLRLRLPLDRD